MYIRINLPNTKFIDENIVYAVASLFFEILYLFKEKYIYLTYWDLKITVSFFTIMI